MQVSEACRFSQANAGGPGDRHRRPADGSAWRIGRLVRSPPTLCVRVVVTVAATEREQQQSAAGGEGDEVQEPDRDDELGVAHRVVPDASPVRILSRMSFIGSTDRTLGIESKLWAGGGEVVNHSSVLPFHGSGPATRP
jgi:hypothetical protein